MMIDVELIQRIYGGVLTHIRNISNAEEYDNISASLDNPNVDTAVLTIEVRKDTVTALQYRITIEQEI
jgi:hypothetical protein